MAGNTLIPRMARGTQAPSMHPRDFSQAASHIPDIKPVRVGGGGSVVRRGSAGGGVGAGFGAAAERGQDYNDPALTGSNFQHIGVAFGGIPLGEGWLTQKGQLQQYDNKQWNNFIGARAQAIANGASP